MTSPLKSKKSRVLEFKEISFGSDFYRQSLVLRELVLRVPIGLVLSAEDVLHEDRQRHFVMIEGNVLVACVVCKFLDDDKIKLRQMAVSPACQGRGIGRQLIMSVEEALSELPGHFIEMSARKSAVGFYEKLGYHTTGSSYVEQGIPHVRMVKNRA